MSALVIHVLPHRGGGGETYVDMLERLPGFVHERVYLSRGRSPASGLASIPRSWLRLAARSRHAALIHVHGDVAAVLSFPLLRTRPAVMTTHGLHMLRRTSGRRRVAMSCALAATCGRCRAVICTSASERDDLARVLTGPSRDKLRLIHNGIDPPPIVDAAQRAALRQQLGASADTVLGLFVGQLEARKAPLVAARAATRARAAGVPFTLAVAGDGPLARQLEALSGDAVKLLGYRSDLHELMAAADMFVAPSKREGMSLALLEAMGQGLAVVAADGPGNPEAVGDAGMLFAAGDEDALTSALELLSAQPERRASLGVAARTRVLEHFTAARFLQETDAVYREAMASLTAPARAGGGPRA